MFINFHFYEKNEFWEIGCLSGFSFSAKMKIEINYKIFIFHFLNSQKNEFALGYTHWLPCALAISAKVFAMACSPTGAIQIGMLIRSPNKDNDISTLEIPCKIRGFIRNLEKK